MAKQSPDQAHLDRIKRLALVAMFADDMLLKRLVFKGGNALDLVLHISTRASVDLDFSMQDEFPSEQLDEVKRLIEQRMTEIFSPAGYVVFDVSLEERPPGLTPDLADFWGGYLLTFKLVEKAFYDVHRRDLPTLRRNATEVAPGQRRKFEIDISKHEYVGDKRREEFDGYTIYVYSPEMLAIEKLRAICQQMPEYGPAVKRNRAGSPRARDFLDLKTLVTNCALDLTRPDQVGLLKKIFSAKRVPLELLGLIEQTREFHRQDWPAVEQTVKAGTALDSFDHYFDFVVRLANQLLAAAKPAGT